MAIQYTQAKLYYSKKYLCIHTSEEGNLNESSIVCDIDNEDTAALICDAMNNTAGNGIDPNAVPKLLEALRGCVDYITHNDSDIPAALIKAKIAIKAVELK